MTLTVKELERELKMAMTMINPAVMSGLQAALNQEERNINECMKALLGMLPDKYIYALSALIGQRTQAMQWQRVLNQSSFYQNAVQGAPTPNTNSWLGSLVGLLGKK